MSDDAVLDCSILIVDDLAALGAALTAVLRHEGFRDIRSTTDPLQSLQMVESRLPDIVLLDLRMPDLDGIELMAAIQARLDASDFLPMVMLTADSDVAVKRRALAAGAADFLLKPFDSAEVVLRIRNLLATRVLHRRLEGVRRELSDRLDAQPPASSPPAGERDLRHQRIVRALAGGVSHLVFQPIVDIDGGRLIGLEALSRFDLEPDRSPDRWFAEAREVGLAFELEFAAVLAALGELPNLPADCFLAVNVSADTAATDRFGEALESIDLSRVVMEVTEHSRVDDYDTLLPAVAALRTRGARFAVDDAGAGYASLLHILRLRPDIIKLDLALVRGIDSDPLRQALAEALVSFGRRIGALMLAEGVETPAELSALSALGVDGAQGYFCGRPAPLVPTGASTATPMTATGGGRTVAGPED